jgi:GH24 family phage-related lysozyme (muramidase)
VNDDIALAHAAKLAKAFEGCKLTAYWDAYGKVWTVGWGITGPDVREGTVWSQQHADYRLLQRLALDFARVKATWPGAERLHPKAQASLIDLVYNRGASLTKRASDPLDRRREMRELQPPVVLRDYPEMAFLHRSMKRIWAGESMGGLLKRCDARALLCDEAFIESGRA